MIKAFIFDMDGTLIDTEKYYRKFWPLAVQKMGYSMTDGQALELRSLGRPYAPAKFKEWYGENFDYEQARTIRSQLMEPCLKQEGIRPKAGALALLQTLKERNITRAVATASDLEKTHRYLKEAGLEDYFDALISAHQVERGKPAPDIYEYACATLGYLPKECVAVEDSPNGVLSAYRAGCKVIMIPDQSEPDEKLREYLYECRNSLADISLDF